MISNYTSNKNSFNMAALLLLSLAAICNWYSEFVHKWEIFLLLLYILDVQWGYGTIKKWPSLYIETLEGYRTWSILDWN